MTRDDLLEYASALAAVITRRALKRLPYGPGAETLKWLEEAHSVEAVEGGYIVTLWAKRITVRLHSGERTLTASAGPASACVSVPAEVTAPIDETLNLHNLIT